MDVEIRGLRPAERDAWLGLRERLWPDFTRDDLTAEQEEILADQSRNAVLVAASPNGQLVGFVEVALREWAEGCRTHPVGHIEAWYVEPEHRRAGVGRALIEAAERWAISRGCTEMGSDAEVANHISQRAHAAIGYSEVLRIVLFSKNLQGG